METWQRVWRDGFAPGLSDAGLEALRDALVDDDPRLLQGCTTLPAALEDAVRWPVEAACVIGYCGWQSEGLETVAAVEEFFARACLDADERLGCPAACRWFLNWFDETPRDQMRELLLPEVVAILATRVPMERRSRRETIKAA